MEDLAYESTEIQTYPVRVEVVNTEDFHEDLQRKVITAIAVTVAAGVTKIAVEAIHDKIKVRKRAKKAKKIVQENTN